MGRALRRGENRLGWAGLGLLRLRSTEDASVADTIVAEIRALLTDLETDQGENSVRYPVLDADAGYARWAEVYDQLENEPGRVPPGGGD